MKGLFLGLTTLDICYLVGDYPDSNEKIVALEGSIVAGGPATNAAVAFSAMGNDSHLAAVVGKHPLSAPIKEDLTSQGVKLRDLQPHWPEPPPLSSIIVTRNQGDRAVVSLNATRCQAHPENAHWLDLENLQIILVDGHQLAVSEAILKETEGIPKVLDGGSWKPGLEKILPFIDYAICSSNFHPPGCQTREDTFTYLYNWGIKQIAITGGEKAIQYVDGETRNSITIPTAEVVDTSGAGDIFHGAFCHYILQENWVTALKKASLIAVFSCGFFSTRQWIKELQKNES
jgi:sugar/nucleoside kinase (ribokinase family)